MDKQHINISPFQPAKAPLGEFHSLEIGSWFPIPTPITQSKPIRHKNNIFPTHISKFAHILT